MEVKLRQWKLEDAPAMQALADNPKVAANLRDAFPSPYTLEDAENFIRICRDAEALLCIEVDGEVAGCVGATRGQDVARLSAEIGYWLGEPFWGKGVMTRAVNLMAEHCFSKTDLVRLYADPFAYNKASCRVLEKSGFTLEGVMRRSVFKRGEIFDQCLYARIKED